MEEELSFEKPIGIKLEGEASSMGIILAKWLISKVNEYVSNFDPTPEPTFL